MEQLKEESMQYEAGEIQMRPLLEFLERASRVPKGKNACIVEAFRELEAVRELYNFVRKVLISAMISD
jgi:hypothetical protein